MEARRRINPEGPALALLTLGGFIVIAALVVGSAASVEECGYVLFLLIGLGAALGRAELAEINRRAWVGIFGGRGEWVPRVWRPLWFGWGALASVACAIALIGSLVRALS